MTPRERIEAKEQRIKELGSKPNPKGRKYGKLKFPSMTKKAIEHRKDRQLSIRKSNISTTKKSKVYLILLWKGKEKFLKVGMTTQSLNTRFKDIPYKWKELRFVEVDSKMMYEYEQAIHGLMKKHKYRPTIKFGGYTECYTLEAKNQIIKLIGG